MENIPPNTPQVAVFDTSFHQTIPAKNFMYALPYKYYEEYRVRRYGFHGTSHRYVSRRACEILGVPYEEQKIITAHVGNGGSIAAVDHGKCVDTSMGLTPVEGLLMGTRCGDVDAGALSFKRRIGWSWFIRLDQQEEWGCRLGRWFLRYA